jgi:hypothetical protein
MNTLEQLKNFLSANTVIASQFRGILEGNEIPYKEGHDPDDDTFIFSLVGESGTEFIFESENDGELLAIAIYNP